MMGEKGYMLGLYEKAMPNALALPEKLEKAAEHGFDYLELSIDESDEKLVRLEWSREKRQGFVRAQWEAGVPVRSICLSAHRKYPLGSEDAAVRQRGRDILQRAVELAAETGIRLIQLAGYDEYYQPSNERTRALFEENLGWAVQVAAGYGVTLAFETMETPFMDTCEKAMRYVRAIDSPWLQVYPDSGNLANSAALYGRDVMADFAAAKGHVAALHLKETRPGVYREVPYGEGHTPFAEFIKAALEQGVRMFLAEFWADDLQDWEVQIAQASSFLKETCELQLSTDFGSATNNSSLFTLSSIRASLKPVLFHNGY